MSQSAGELLFSKPFNVEMYEYDAIDERMVGARGSFTTGAADLDMAISRRRTRVWRTINQLLDIYHAGSEFTMVGGMKAIHTMHEIIQEHIGDVEAYMKSMARSMHVEDPAITSERLKDLQALDELGRHVFNRVRLSKKEFTHTPFKGFLDFDPSLIQTTTAAKVIETRDYVPVTERLDYSVLRQKKRWQ